MMYEDFNTLPLIKSIREDSIENLHKFLEENYKEYEADENGEFKKKIEIIDKQTQSTPLFYVTARKNDEESVKICQLLIEKFGICNPASKDLMKQTCLFYAAREGHLQLCKYLIEKGCNPNDADNFGQTCLFYASREGKTDCVDIIIKKGGNPNLLDLNKQTCLFYACREGRYDTVKCLLENGVNPSIKDAQRRTALTFAKGNGHNNIINLLKNAGTSAKPGSVVHTQAKNAKLNTAHSMVSVKSEPHANASSNVDPIGSGDSQRKKYRLQYQPLEDEPELWLDAPLIKIKEFERKFPDLALWPKNGDVIKNENSNLNDAFNKQWYSIANQIIQALSKYEGGHIFERLVDTKKQNCPDYYDVIKNPMSFSCIKAKLKKGQYSSPQEFISDVQLVFYNCSIYNTAGTIVAITGKNIEAYFNNQLIVTGFNNFVQKEKTINEHLQKVEEENERWAEEHPNNVKEENSENNNELNQVSENQLNNETNNEQNSEANNDD
ncbi:bromodomain protein 1, putative [Plasmodium chabaudi chabaudi]|uniref:Bromodomain protein 1, putative n=1 Tax=Plasmodium chabaudi chabaudi TaxID=31271 RepID=A0A4V0K5W0_PLACU|nr:bromodomain protein 1, putative [Plasmodium chabaudi chabaudi]VTZ67513.1 bromodomain protein 1, putative [Plasmodium chabaudi chabaudi]|eukprot:XP_016655223.1 bromodomain protein, putative [Plasmodium chabaudi chabaudi]